jgi:hypothetical protein
MKTVQSVGCLQYALTQRIKDIAYLRELNLARILLKSISRALEDYPEKIMSKQVITVDGEQQIVREDTARAYRGVYWALISLLAFIVIAALLFVGGFFSTVTHTPTQNAPASTERPGAP